MAIPVPRKIVEFALLGPTHDRRQLQDSPILGDVWLAFADAPDEAIELLIEPHWQVPAGKVAAELNAELNKASDHPDDAGADDDDGADIAALHGIVAARLRFDDVITKVVPRTSWWNKEVTYKRYLFLTANPTAPASELSPSDERENPVARAVAAARAFVSHWVKGNQKKRDDSTVDDGTLPALDRFLALVTLIRWAAGEVPPSPAAPTTHDDAVRERLQTLDDGELRKRIGALLDDMPAPVSPSSKEVKKFAATGKAELRVDIIWQVSLNRRATPALVASVPAVKGDAARRLFEVSCKQIAWAVIDSGIQGDHKAFYDADDASRVRRSFDFTNIREIVSLDNLKESRMKKRLGDLLDKGRQLREPPTYEEAVDYLTRLAEDSREGRPIHWEYVRRFVEIRTDARPKVSDHGTHVAGIIGASARKERAERNENNEDASDLSDGMCPDIQLYDFRVLAADLKQTEFAIIAALQFIRFLNSQTDYMAIHGANLSLSIQHDVRNYACGRTPICLECERLVDSGVVVVAAAGNLGYQSFQTTEGSYDGYAAFSVTDPGNADGVLTVGSTHRSAPHMYGVSFFSSRGPTGDGRAKPDIVAPGERIRAPFREAWGDLDGTSMAAPHVSGAAAMLMARYAELIGQPRRIKKILCDSATDLGRERTFQGAGMLDVLRAFQSI